MITINDIKRAVADISVRQPDLDEGRAKKSKTPEGQEKPVELEASDVGTTPESVVTQKYAHPSAEAEQAYAAAFFATCEQAGLDKDAVAGILGSVIAGGPDTVPRSD